MTDSQAPMIRMTDVDICFYIQENGHVSMKDFIFHPGRYKLLQKSYVLKNVNLQINKGESFALLGKNGSGKSTLLRALSGIMTPDKGKIEIFGAVAPLLGLGVGLEQELTGIENIRLLCALMGMTKSEIKNTLPEIIEFSELGEAINWQVKRYSTGMMSRLSFSIAIIKQPEILLIDEVLSVGDLGFQHKCLKKVMEIKEKGATIIFVSHNFEEVANMCTRAALINHGTVEFIGSVEEVGIRYHKLFEE